MQEEVEAEEILDSRGIPGWDRVNALAVALMEPKGLAATAAQAQVIVDAYVALLDYDKRPIQFQRRRLSQQRPRGRFARVRQCSSGQVSMEKMKR